MKKKIFVISMLVLLLTLSGCSFKMTPKKKVEMLLNNYQKQNDVIITELDDYLKTITDSTNYDEYKKVYMRQYQNLTYEIKDETIDGDNAKVTAQIEVYDYYKVDTEAKNYITNNPNDFTLNGVYDTNKGILYRIGELLKTTDRVTYTITINLTKVNNEWTVDTLTNEDLEKIHGTYMH